MWQIAYRTYKCTPKICCVRQVSGSCARFFNANLIYLYTFFRLLWPCFLHWLKIILSFCYLSLLTWICGIMFNRSTYVLQPWSNLLYQLFIKNHSPLPLPPPSPITTPKGNTKFETPSDYNFEIYVNVEISNHVFI